MKRNRTFFVPVTAGCLFVFAAFSQSPQPDNLSKLLIGEWRNIYVKIVIHHLTNPPVTIEADTSNWDVILGFKPIRTHFKEDGTYYSEYRDLKDSIVREVAGVWTVKGDSLTMKPQLPDNTVLRFQVKIDKDVGSFSGVIDAEGDGVVDDEYFGRQRKFQ